MGDPTQVVVDIASISDIDRAVIFAGDSSSDFLAEVGVFDGVNVSGVRTTPWNELVELVRRVRPRAK